MKELFLNLLSDEDGQGMVEYGIIVALIAIVAIVAVKKLGTTTAATFDKAAGEMGKVGTGKP